MQSTSEPSAITGEPEPQRATHIVGNAGVAALDGEAFLLEDARQVLAGLELLEAEFGEAEDHVGHLLTEVEHRLRLHVGGDGRS